MHLPCASRTPPHTDYSFHSPLYADEEELQIFDGDEGIAALTAKIIKKNNSWLRQGGKCEARTLVEERKTELRNSEDL